MLEAVLDTRFTFGQGKVTARPCIVALAHRVSGQMSDELLTGATVSGSKVTNTESEKSRSRGLVLSLKLTPGPRPEIPTGLAWYHQEPMWQTIAREALQGRVREYAVDIQYAEDFSVNEKLKTKLQAELKLFGGKLRAHVDMESETFVRELKNSKMHQLRRPVTR